jgi:hypothetical protein
MEPSVRAVSFLHTQFYSTVNHTMYRCIDISIHRYIVWFPFTTIYRVKYAGNTVYLGYLEISMESTYSIYIVMFGFLRSKKNKKDFKSVADKQLKENKAVLESLRDYDEGKKEISTVNVKKHLPNIRTTS